MSAFSALPKTEDRPVFALAARPAAGRPDFMVQLPIFHDAMKKTTPGGGVFFMVEARGVEPLSESNLTRLSTGVVCYFHSLSTA